MKLIISRTTNVGSLDSKATRVTGIELLLLSESSEDSLILKFIENDPKLLRFSLRDEFFWEYNPKAKKGDLNEK